MTSLETIKLLLLCDKKRYMIHSRPPLVASIHRHHHHQHRYHISKFLRQLTPQLPPPSTLTPRKPPSMAKSRHLHRLCCPKLSPVPGFLFLSVDIPFLFADFFSFPLFSTFFLFRFYCYFLFFFFLILFQLFFLEKVQ